MGSLKWVDSNQNVLQGMPQAIKLQFSIESSPQPATFRFKY